MFEQKKKLKSLLIECANKQIKDDMTANEKKHISICRAILKQSEMFNVPIGVILYLGIGTNAHKLPIFNDGYKKIPDYDKIKKVLSMSEICAKKFGYPKLKSNSGLIHFLSRFYDKGGKIGELKTYLTTIPKDYNILSISNAKGWASILLKDNNALLTDKGYYGGK